MPLTSPERDRILATLGYSITQDVLDNINQRVAILDSISPDAVTRIKAYLTEMTAIEAQIKTARDLPGSAIAQLKTEARRLTSLIALALSLDIRQDTW
jgi:hypothetical protein